LSKIGRKAQKKKDKKNANHLNDLTDKQRNPKAFAFNSAVRAERKFRRKQDIDTKKQHIPLVDRTPIEPPPILVAVVGPPKVGKSTLINNLIKLFTRSPLVEMKGPVTIVTGKKRRITFIECNNDVNSMIDLAKIADLVLLMCDASFGFEMEVFEFLNICQVHGMPKIMGILTHLDMIKNAKTLKNTKKTLKHRFWTEVYPGAKLFYLSGILHEEYLRNEIRNLGRFISVMKFRPLTWRTTHGYLLGDRYEDLTNQELIRKNPKCDRSISLYGYVRGVPIKKDSSLHVAGLGDVRIQDISFLPDPCPLPEQIKKRALIEKEKLIYAPFSGVGGIVYDKDAVYVELGGSHSHNRKNEDESDNIVTNLIDTKKTLDVKMAHSKMRIFSEGQELTAKDFEESDDESEDEEKELYEKKDGESKKEDEALEGELAELRGQFGRFKEETVEDSGRIRRKVIFETGDEEFSKVLSDDEEKDEECADSGEEDVIGQAGHEESEDEEQEKLFKDGGVHSKISDILKKLEEKKQKQDEQSEESSDDEEVPAESTRRKKKSEITQNEEIDAAVSKKIDKKKKHKQDLNEKREEFIEELEEAGSLVGDSSGEEDEEELGSDEEKSESEDELSENEDDLNEDSEEEMQDDGVKWKENLAEKAQNAFLDRQNTTQNLMKLVYGKDNSMCRWRYYRVTICVCGLG
jgi:ribosome biogenesis protein BMS1